MRFCGGCKINIRLFRIKTRKYEWSSGFYTENGKQKSPGNATSRSCSQPPTPGGREKVTQIKVSIANKQMHDKHKDQLTLPQAR